MTGLLEPNIIKLIIENLNTSVEHLKIEDVSKLYLAISRVYKNECFQEYEQMKAKIFDKVENSELSIEMVLTLCLPMSLDGC